MDYMFEVGFLGTRAPFFMDFVTIIVAILPLLMIGAILLAVTKKYKYHALAQIVLFIVTVVVLIYFEVGVRMGGGFKGFMEDSSVSYDYAFIVLIAHIVISVLTLIIWFLVITRTKKHLRENTHKKMARATFVGVLFTSLSGIWVYFLLFVY
ncbi:MAG: DUF420 domain-containing protein [Sulfurimonas sp.]|nr:DUF420 domain-containing protein [Sulfurimonas sp.]